MDDQLATLNHAVAAAADAHLTDPLDAAVYGRLVAAVLDRRGYLAAPLPLTTADGAPLPAFPTPTPLAGEADDPHTEALGQGSSPDNPDDEGADDDADVDGEVDVVLPPLLELSGDPREVLARLRRS